MSRTPGARNRVRQWPRGVRLALYTAAVILTIGLMSVWIFVFAFIQASCGDPSQKSGLLCSDTGQVLIPVVEIALLPAVGIPWVLFLARVLGLRKGEDVVVPAAEDVSSTELLASWSDQDVALPFGQHLISGNVEAMDVSSHRLGVQGFTLRFWGGYALRSGQIGIGDRAAFVYQRVPLLDVKYVLAFWKGGDARIEGVGGLIHAFFIFLAISGVSVVPPLKESYPAWFIPVCGVLFVVSSVYLTLLFFAKRALHGFSGDGAST